MVPTTNTIWVRTRSVRPSSLWKTALFSSTRSSSLRTSARSAGIAKLLLGGAHDGARRDAGGQREVVIHPRPARERSGGHEPAPGRARPAPGEAPESRRRRPPFGDRRRASAADPAGATTSGT